MLSELEFEKIADQTLHQLDSALSDQQTAYEVDLQSGILTIEFADGTKYIVNSHRAALQIWMAAERSAWHFDYHPQEKKWISNKNNEELWSTVASVLSKKLNCPVSLTHPS